MADDLSKTLVDIARAGMSEARHTPGPWTAFYKAKYNEWHVAVPSGSGWNLALFSDGLEGPDEDREANARLIAAAPDLLYALQLICDAGAERIGISHMDRARAAVAKAEGRS